MMRVLFLSTWFPYPPDNGSRIRAYNLLKQLARQHEIDLLSFAQDGYGQVLGDLPALCASVQTVPWITYCPRRLRALAGFFSPTPRLIVDIHSPAMARMVTRQLMVGKPDLVVATQIGTAPYVHNPSPVPTVFEELETSVIKDAVKRAEGVPARVRNWLTWAKLRHYVANLVQRFDACTVASAQELDNLRQIAPGYQRAHVLPNGVDVDHYRPSAAVPEPNTLIYNGALTFRANYDAIAWFVADILPRVQAEVPQATLRVTGSTQGVDIDRLSTCPGVKFTGYLDDIRPAVASSWICAVPLRVGGGTRLKILEAMALGTPVVATSKGAEGLAVTPEQDILIADNPAEFARQTVRLLRDGELRQRLAENGRRLVERSYSWTEIGRQFNALLESVISARQHP